MNFIVDFVVGAFICNSLPHLLSGLQGLPLPTPFAKPSGVGDSSPLVNFLWGAFNLAAAVSLLAWHPLAIGFHANFGVLVIGFLTNGIFLSCHFGKVRQDKSAKAPVPVLKKEPLS